MKKKNEIIADYFLDKILPWLIGICILIFGAYYIFNIFLQDREQFFSDDNKIRIIEAKYPLGSIFNKDAIDIAPDKIIFYANSFFQSKAISLPYKKIERIVLTDGQYWDSIKIETRGFLSKNYKIYIRHDVNRKKVKASFEALNLEIVEQKTILKHFFDNFIRQDPLNLRGNQGIPQNLFGLKLGGIYTLGKEDEPNDAGTIPVKECTGIDLRPFGYAMDYYFKPLKNYNDFKYLEYKKNQEEKYFRTSFRLFLMPVIPNTVKSSKELEKLLINEIEWKVMLIEWSAKAEKKEEAYYWAADLCESVKVDLAREPEIYDWDKPDYYQCTFKEGDRELIIKNLAGLKLLNLSYTDEKIGQFLFRKK